MKNIGKMSKRGQ